MAKREWQLGRWCGLLSAVAVGALLGVMGPFGSQSSLSSGAKYVFWMTATLVGFGAILVSQRLLPPAEPVRRPALRILAVAAISAVPMTFFVAWAMGVARPGRSFGPLQILGLFPWVALVQLLIAWVVSRGDDAEAAAPAHAPSVAPAYPPEFLAKLPPPLRQDIIALESEDHYLRVHTRHGSALILMRLADAAAMIDPRLGLRVHRSWWVAKDGVRALERKNGQTVARLVDDTPVPVSRSYLPAARAALGD